MTPREILSVSATATAAEVAARFRELCKRLHPDRGGDPAEFARVTEAYRAIRSEARRVKPESSSRAVMDALAARGGFVPEWARRKTVDFSKLKLDTSRGGPAEWTCYMCGRVNKCRRDDLDYERSCDECRALSMEGPGSKMLDDLLALESGLTDRELQFVESMAQQRNRHRSMGFAPAGWPSEKQVAWLQKIHERTCER